MQRISLSVHEPNSIFAIYIVNWYTKTSLTQISVKLLPTCFLAIFPSLLILVGCYPEGPESNNDYNLIISAFDPEIDFSTLTSFSMPDTLVLLNDSTATELVELTEQQKQAFLDAIRNNLNTYGWADSTEFGNADTYVLASAIVAKYSDNIWNEWKWYDKLDRVKKTGPDSRYPWYPSLFPYVYDFTQGSLMITMIETEKIDTSSSDIPVVWIGGLNGIINSKTINTSDVISSIDKLFELSEHLHKN